TSQRSCSFQRGLNILLWTTLRLWCMPYHHPIVYASSVGDVLEKPGEDGPATKWFLSLLLSLLPKCVGYFPRPFQHSTLSFILLIYKEEDLQQEVFCSFNFVCVQNL